MHRLKADGRSSSKSPGTSAPSHHASNIGVLHCTTHNGGQCNAPGSKSHSRESLRGILFALAVAGGFWGIHVLAALLVRFPVPVAAVLGCVVGLSVATARRKAVQS